MRWKSAAEAGLAPPEATISVSLKDGAGTYTLLVGGVSTGTSHFAEKEGDPTIVTVGANASGWALADQAKFAKTADAGAPPAAKPDATKLSQAAKAVPKPPKH